VYVSPAQIRRCELRAGDEVSGPARPPRRSERHPSLVRVATVNGADAEPPEERPEFADLTPVHPTERLPAPPALDAVPFGKGSRVAISGGPGAGATRLLREIVSKLTGVDATLTLVLVGARPEEVTEWSREDGLAVSGGSFDRPLEAQIQAAELAVERAKRAVERGGHAVVVIDSLEFLPPGPMRRIFGAARNVEEGGSLTVIGAIGGATEALRQASTRITLDDAAEEPTVLGALSGTQRADLLA
jgi:transcription termination factor Rho